MAQVRQRDTTSPPRGMERIAAPLRARVLRWLPDWLGHWQLWLALLIGGWLRLFALDQTLWLDDQTQLLDMARTAILRGMIPATGIPASVGILNHPISIYFLLPIAAFTANPLPQTIALALWNVVGVAICYVATLRGFGRRAAAWSALFFAVCPASVWYSRFLWQQNFIAPLLGLWALTLFAAVKNNERRWFVANVILLTLCVLLHPTVAYLAPVTLAALLLTPRRPRPLEYTLAALGALLLLLPTLLWEAHSGWSDLVVLQHASQASANYDGEVVAALFNVLGGPSPQALGAGTPYDTLMPAFNALTALTLSLFVVGWLGLTRRVWLGLRAAWRRAPAGGTTWRDRLLWARSVADCVCGDERWRLYFVLWLWVTVPPVTMIRHSITIFPHYLIVLYPGVFMAIGLGATWIVNWARGRARSIAPDQFHARAGQIAHVGLRAAPIILLSALLGGLTLQSTLHTTSVASSRYSAFAGYGFPLNSMLNAVDALNALQRREGIARVDIIAAPRPGDHNDLATLLRAERAERSMMDGACLRSPGAGESLVVAEQSALPASHLLGALPNATRIGALPLHGDEPATVYRVQPLHGALAGEVSAGSTTFGAVGQPALRLEGYQRVAPNLLLLRWTTLRSSVSIAPLLTYRIQAIDAASPAPEAVGRALCGATQWSAGDTLFTWLRLKSADNEPLRLQVTAEQVDYPTFHAAGLTWFAGHLTVISSARLDPPGGVYILPQT
jgi:hypothetical protein